MAEASRAYFASQLEYEQGKYWIGIDWGFELTPAEKIERKQAWLREWLMWYMGIGRKPAKAPNYNDPMLPYHLNCRCIPSPRDLYMDGL